VAENRKLLAEQEILRNEACTGPQRGAQRADNGLQDREHGGEVRAGRGPYHPRIAPADALCWPLTPHAVRPKESCENAFFVPTPTVSLPRSRGRIAYPTLADGLVPEEIIASEIGLDMARFPTVAHLVFWVGQCPRSDESAGKRHSLASAPQQCPNLCRRIPANAGISATAAPSPPTIKGDRARRRRKGHAQVHAPR
jgi:hypothetical protein